MTLEAFWKGDLAPVEGFLADDIAEQFRRAIAARRAADFTVGNRIEDIAQPVVVSAALEGMMAEVTLRFDARIESVTRDGEGRVVEGAPGEPVATTDVWTFARFTAEGDYNLTTNMHKDPRTLLLNLAGPTPGVPLQLGPVGSSNYGIYFENFAEPSSDDTIESGTFTFTEFDPVRGVFSATFEAVAKNTDGVTLRITHGVVKDGKIGKDQSID
jgi:hypothetical protein